MAKKVLILGAGYGGLVCALEFRKQATASDAEVTLVNKHSYHQLITQLHETATGAKSDQTVRVSIEQTIAGKNIRFVKDTVTEIDREKRIVTCTGQELSYDLLVIALGSENEYFGIPGMKEHSLTLKSVNQARLIRTHVERCFAQYHYERTADYLTFVIGGAGFSGIELVGEFADAIPKWCAENNISRSMIKLYNVEAMPGILPGFEPELVAHAERSLKERGVTFLLGTPIVQVEPGKVHLKTGDVLETQTFIWTGGVRGHSVVMDAGFEAVPNGRSKVNEYLQALGNEDVYIIGDSCIIINSEINRPFPPTAQIAGQMGTATAKYLYSDLKGGKKTPFVPEIAGTVASLGRKDAIGRIGKSFRTTGRPAYIVKDLSNMRYLMKIGALFQR